MSKSQHIQLYNRDGTSQQQRESAEIKPLYAKIDDRHLKDLLSFLWKIAEYIQYYDSGNFISGHWQNFIGVEKAVLLALIAAEDTAPLHYTYLERQSEVEETDGKDAYLPLFELLYDHCLELKRLYEHTHRVLGKELFLSSQNTRLLASTIQNLSALYRVCHSVPEGESHTYISQVESIGKDMGLPDVRASSLRSNLPDGPGFQMISALYDVHQDTQKLFKTVIGHADNLLEKSMKRRGDFQPHVGLMLTFLRLFGRYQKQLNGLTAKHLEYYYKDVLKIDYRREIADKVFVIIQLAKKKADSYKLEKGTEFKAAKDSQGKDRFYKATEDFVANKSEVVELKSIYHYAHSLDEKGKAQKIEFTEIPYKSVKAAPKADSLNGKNEDLDKENPQFPPFCDDRVKEYAEVGFAFASPVLRLGGGERAVTIALKLVNSLVAEAKSLTDAFAKLPVDLTDMFEMRLTCAKGWEEFSSNKGNAEEFAVKLRATESGDPQIEVTFTLDGSFPAVVDFDKKIHLDRFAEDRPVCKVVLRQDGQKNYYELFTRMSLSSITVSVDVSLLKDLVLQNDQGLLKPEKPIMIFGNEPMVGSSFYIGSQEVFSKKLDTLSIKWEWMEDYLKQASDLYGNYQTLLTDMNGNFPAVKVAIEQLVDKEWQPFKNEWILPQGTDQLFKIDYIEPGESVKAGFVGVSVVKNKFKELTSFKNYSLQLQDGFIKIVLADNNFLFGHKRHAEALSVSLKSLSIQTKPEGGIEITNPTAFVGSPITPMIQNVALSYKSSVTSSVTAEDKNLHFFHLHPFGISREKLKIDSEKTSHPLIADLSAEGYFYIGLEGLVPPQNVSLLFQFVDGTGDLRVDVPDEVRWSYLATEGWQDFDGRGVLKDGTRDFSGTGIVLLSIPKEATDKSTLMPVKRHWVRAAVSESSRAVNRLASVRSQAMQLEFDDRNNAADHYETALPAKKISRLLESVAEVKSVTQPFASFGGRPREGRRAYSVRVSERLRHKDRAVTLWDYERLVLENFPQIHKVKCLNHTNDDADVAPGHVRVVVIPNLANLNAVNILRPAASTHLRSEITEFLEQRCSTFVRLKVVNPRYDELRVIADVAFCKNCDVGYYNAQLSDDIKDFLTPWKSNIEEIHFHETLHSSMILNFIEEREYVDYLSSFSVEKSAEGEETTSVVLDDIVRSHADSLFVSAKEHAINK